MARKTPTIMHNIHKKIRNILKYMFSNLSYQSQNGKMWYIYKIFTIWFKFSAIICERGSKRRASKKASKYR